GSRARRSLSRRPVRRAGPGDQHPCPPGSGARQDRAEREGDPRGQGHRVAGRRRRGRLRRVPRPPGRAHPGPRPRRCRRLARRPPRRAGCRRARSLPRGPSPPRPQGRQPGTATNCRDAQGGSRVGEGTDRV
ncbi:MAG: hypothetical protein AVDCRST_MAG49-4458, partial [uncultured Thermomicrobiales bacterium]